MEVRVMVAPLKKPVLDKFLLEQQMDADVVIEDVEKYSD